MTILYFCVCACRIDGLLFINLTNEDWPDMGIVNKFHCKKLALILKSYRARYQRRLEKKKDLDDDDDISDYAPSELSDLLAQESGSETEQEEVLGSPPRAYPPLYLMDIYCMIRPKMRTIASYPRHLLRRKRRSIRLSLRKSVSRGCWTKRT